MSGPLAGHRVLVTGASRGIGRVVALEVGTRRGRCGPCGKGHRGLAASPSGARTRISRFDHP